MIEMYTILCAPTTRELEKKVNDLYPAGWRTEGPLLIDRWDDSFKEGVDFIQAMRRVHS